ncbi:UPF0149 family protein [Alcanivorax sp. JB21]|uniref:UPF0149 family protein n=1 Tax=Alcanivorax limicola TaxID=2874102 RepID=UPI001CBBD03F|nr:UPF0149 family protein [Alcanivorax limicola]MBZ2189157.1 UPF0149 family protein [Alcanivorax limicola]
MTQRTADYFEPLADALASAGVRHSPTELHGVICGLLSTGAGGQDAELLGMLAAHSELVGQWPAEAAKGFVALRDLAASGYAGETLELALLLPDDDEELGVRVAALAQWCEGFLVGFGTGSAGVRDSDLAPGLQEALSDLAAVSQAELPEENSPEEEAMFEQIAEHCRMAALMIFTEIVMVGRKTPAGEGADTPPVRH